MDPATKYHGHLLLSHIIAKFAIHKHIVLQVRLNLHLLCFKGNDYMHQRYECHVRYPIPEVSCLHSLFC